MRFEKNYSGNIGAGRITIQRENLLFTFWGELKKEMMSPDKGRVTPQ
jgi:hypothetical protein